MNPIQNDPKLIRGNVQRQLEETSKNIISRAIRDAFTAMTLDTNLSSLSTRHNLPQVEAELNCMEASKLKVFTKLFDLTHDKKTLQQVKNYQILKNLEVPSDKNPELTSEEVILTYHIMKSLDSLYNQIQTNHPEVFEDNTLWE